MEQNHQNLPTWAKVGLKVKPSSGEILDCYPYSQPEYGIINKVDRYLIHICLYNKDNKMITSRNLWHSGKDVDWDDASYSLYEEESCFPKYDTSRELVQKLEDKLTIASQMIADCRLIIAKIR